MTRVQIPAAAPATRAQEEARVMQFLLFTLLMIYIVLALLTSPRSKAWSAACLALLALFVPLHYINIQAHAEISALYPLFVVESSDDRSVLSLDMAQVVALIELMRRKELLLTRLRGRVYRSA